MTTTVITASEQSQSASSSRRTRDVARNAGLIGLFWLIAILFQIHNHAYLSEFSSYPDEPAHYVTGLLVRDYLGQGFPSNPLKFATNYYLHYPKVGLGHWPPLFYLVEGIWMLALSESRTSVLVLMALLSAMLAWVTADHVRKRLGPSAGIAAGIILLSIPMVQEQTAMVMLETLLGIFSFVAAVSFGNYLETESGRDSLLFGFWTTLAILTKGNGWALLLIPPVALLFTRKLRLLRTRSFWLGMAVIALALPWQIATLKLVREGWNGGPLQTYLPRALKEFTGALIGAAGIPLALLALTGIGIMCLRPFVRGMASPDSDEPRTPSGFWNAMLALVIATILFHAAVPAGIEARKMLIATPALVAFAVAGAHTLVFALISNWIFRRRAAHMKTVVYVRPQWTAAAASIGVLAVFFVSGFRMPIKEQMGLQAIAQNLTADQPHEGKAVLVSGGAQFEGALISETAMREKRPNHVFLRATKLLASVSWDGSQYALRFQDQASMMREIDGLPIEFVVIENRNDVPEFKHHELLKDGIEKDPNWKLVNTHEAASASVLTDRSSHPVDSALLFRRKQAVSQALPGDLKKIENEIGMHSGVSFP